MPIGRVFDLRENGNGERSKAQQSRSKEAEIEQQEEARGKPAVEPRGAPAEEDARRALSRVRVCDVARRDGPEWQTIHGR